MHQLVLYKNSCTFIFGSATTKLSSRQKLKSNTDKLLFSGFSPANKRKAVTGTLLLDPNLKTIRCIIQNLIH